MKGILQKARDQVLENRSFQHFMRLNELLQKDLTPEESKELTHLYSHPESFFADIRKNLGNIRRFVRVMYKRGSRDDVVIFLKELSDENFLREMHRLMRHESKQYNENNVVDWRSAINERNKNMNGLLQRMHSIHDPSLRGFMHRLRLANIERLQNLVMLLDRMIIKLFPKVAQYREYGVRSNDFCRTQFHRFAVQSGEPYHLMMQYYNLSSYRAYMTVVAQINLIDYDICCGKVDKHLEAVLKAAFRSGLDFFLIKIVDDIQDRKLVSGQELSAFLHAFELAMLGKECSYAGNKKCKLLLDFTRVTQRRFTNSKARAKILSRLRRVHLKENNEFKRKIIYTKLIGRLCADLTISNFRIFMNISENRFEEFVRDKAVAGNLFDDLKDYHLDRQEGYGYDAPKIRVLCQTLKSFSKTFIGMSFKNRIRFMNFLILAGLFQTKEMFGLKDMS